jgi:methylenetetrahydrofolate--tRNA-(uracil-5-)-methyltransferase
LLNHITGGADAETYQPMNVNFGLFPPLEGARGGRKRKGDRKAMMADRAGEALREWMAA